MATTQNGILEAALFMSGGSLLFWGPQEDAPQMPVDSCTETPVQMQLLVAFVFALMFSFTSPLACMKHYYTGGNGYVRFGLFSLLVAAEKFDVIEVHPGVDICAFIYLNLVVLALMLTVVRIADTKPISNITSIQLVFVLSWAAFFLLINYQASLFSAEEAHSMTQQFLAMCVFLLFTFYDEYLFDDILQQSAFALCMVVIAAEKFGFVGAIPCVIEVAVRVCVWCRGYSFVNSQIKSFASAVLQSEVRADAVRYFCGVATAYYLITYYDLL